MLIRRAFSSDTNTIAMINHAGGITAWSDQQLAQALLRQQVDLALLQQQPAAFAIWQLLGDEAELHLLVCHENWRRQGLARALLDAFIAEHKPQGMRRLLLEVRYHNHAAVAFYQYYGFQTIATRKAYYQHPEDDALLMEKLC